MANTQPWDANPSTPMTSLRVPQPRTGDETYTAAPARSRPKRTPEQREDLKINLLLGSLAFGSLTWSFVSYFQPFG